jgi:hypothetical protein
VDFRLSSFMRLLCVVGAALFVGSALSGCGGSTSLPALHSTVNKPPKGNIHRLTVVHKSAIPLVVAKLVRAGAYYSPIRGKKPRLIRSLPKQTPS